MKAVTVIVPAYNHEEFVLETIKSIKYQTFENFQVIIIDDNSCDNTPMIIEKFIEDNNLSWTFIKHKKNIGLISTLNEAFLLANTEYISLLASDDFWAPDKIEKEIEVMNRDKSISMIFTDYYDINEKSEIIRKVHRKKTIYKYKDVLRGYDLPPASMLFRRKSLIDNNDSFNMKNACNVDDLFIWLKCLQNNTKAYIISEPLSYYRLHTQNTVKRAPMRVLNSHYEIIKYFVKPKNEYLNIYCASWALRNFNYLSKSFKKEAFFYLKRCLLLFYKPSFFKALIKYLFF